MSDLSYICGNCEKLEMCALGLCSTLRQILDQYYTRFVTSFVLFTAAAGGYECRYDAPQQEIFEIHAEKESSLMNGNGTVIVNDQALV